MAAHTPRKRILIIAGNAFSLRQFRGKLIEAMRANGHEVIACAPLPEFDTIFEFHVSDLEQLVTKYIPIALTRTAVNPLQDFRLLLQLIHIIYQEKPDLVLGYTIKPVVYGSLAAFLRPGTAAYSMVTGLGYALIESDEGSTLRTLHRKVARLIVKSLYRIALPLNRKVFFFNPDSCTLFVNQGLMNPRKAILVNGSGVDTAYFTPAPAVTEPLRFLMIARLLRDKGIVEYIEAARLVKRNDPNAVFQLLGPYDPHPNAITEAQINTWQGEGIIEYLGTAKDVRPYLSQCSVYVLPSYAEGIPRTVLEAMAMARPIITTDVPGCRETVIEGENGFLTPAKQAEGLAEKMEMFIREPDLIVSMGSRSREIALQKFDVHKVNAVMMQRMHL